MAKPKFQYGTVSILPAKINLKDVSVRISMMIEGDLLDEIRKKAARLHLPYQTLMKQLLRESLGMHDEKTPKKHARGSKPAKPRTKKSR